MPASPVPSVRVVVSALMLLAGVGAAQTAPGARPDWRRLGNTAMELSLASPAGGPVDRAWFSADGTRLFVRTRAGAVLQTTDFEKWHPSTAAAPAPEPAAAAGPLPEEARAVRAIPAKPLRLYAFGGQVLRSDDGGRSWANVTAYQRQSIIGAGMADLAVSPRDPDEIVVANEFGVWRSLDGGISWTGLNDSLPNLPVRRLLGLPQGTRGVRVLAGRAGVLEWAPGEKQAWKPVFDASVSEDTLARRVASEALGAEITALASAGEVLYAGSADGRLWVSLDRGRNWTASPIPESGRVEALFVDSKEPRLALAALAPPGGRGPRVLRTVNGGVFWDDLSSDMPAGAAFGITADRAGGAVYAATERGVYFTRVDLISAGPASTWTALAGLPQTPAVDVKLDPDGNQLFVALQGYGVYAAIAPHRSGRFRWVNGADLSQRPAAPGSLLSVLGGKVEAVRAGDLNFPVLTASETETQIQVPFEARGNSLSLSLQSGLGSVRLGVPLQEVSPAIFVDRDGTPLLLNADTGILLDGMNPARPNSRVQILVTGLGRVRPEWPSGLAAPADDSPQVVAPVRAWVERNPVEVTRAILAPGYIGLYLVEIQLPAVVNAGPAELYIEAEGQQSNRVRLYLEP